MAEKEVIKMKKKSENIRVQKIIKVVQQIAAGNFSANVKISEKLDEFDALATGINMLGEEINLRIRELETGRKTLETQMNAMVDGVAVTDVNGNLIQVNKALAEMLGYKSAKEMVGKSFLKLVAKKDLLRIMKIFMESIKRKRRVIKNLEVTLKRKDGSKFLAMSNIRNLWSKKANLVTSVAVVRDITELKEAEEELRESEEKLRTIFERANDSIIYLSPSGKILEVNRRAVQIFGRPKKELLGKHFTKVGIFSREDISNLVKIFARILRGKEDIINIYIKNKKGQEIFLECSASFIKPDGKISGVIAVARDATERKEMEEEKAKIAYTLRERLKEVRCLYNITNSIRSEVPLKKLLVNTTMYVREAWQYPEFTRVRIKLDGKKYESVKFKETKFKQAADIVVKGKVRGVIEVYYIKKMPESDEGPFLKEERKFLNEIVSYLGAYIEKMETEEKLKASEERLKILFEYAPDGIYLNDLKGNFVDGNKAAERLIGYRKEELIGKSFLKLKLLPPEQIPKAAAALTKSALGKATGPDDFTLIRKDGTHVTVEIRTFPIKIKGKTLVLGIARDATERKKAEKELKRRSEELEKFSKFAVGREIRMINLKKEVNELCKKLGEEPRYEVK